MTALQRLIIEVVVVLLVVAGSAFSGYNYANTQHAKAQVAAATAAAANTTQVATQNAAAAEPVIKYIDRIQYVTKTITREIQSAPQIIEVPAPTRGCPAAITHTDGVLIDAAARGDDPPAQPGADGAPYAAQVVTESVVGNYGACNQYIARLQGLQDYVQRTLINQKLFCPVK